MAFLIFRINMLQHIRSSNVENEFNYMLKSSKLISFGVYVSMSDWSELLVSESARHRNGTILSEDYAEIVDEEGDYSTPASQYILSVN